MRGKIVMRIPERAAANAAFVHYPPHAAVNRFYYLFWIEHNKEHGKDFKRWAEKAKGFDEFGTEVYEAIKEAVEHMEEMNE
jgi:hypothetical protein